MSKIPFIEGDEPISNLERLYSRVAAHVELYKYGKCEDVMNYNKLIKLNQGDDASVVYKVECKRTGEEYALKKIKLSADGVHASYYAARKLLKDTHPSILTLESFCGGSLLTEAYMVFEYCPENLSQLLANIAPLDTSEIKCMMTMLFEGLSHIHQRWFIHGNISPCNLLIASSGMLKIGGFGSMTICRNDIEMDPDIGMPGYRAPELICGVNKYSRAIDMWSAGCILMHLFLHKPFFNDSKSWTNLKQLNDIIKLLGTPSETVMPIFASMPLIRRYGKCIRTQNYAVLDDVFINQTPTAIDMLKDLLKYNPCERKKSKECLNHPYFTEEPRPCDPSLMLSRFIHKRNLPSNSEEFENEPRRIKEELIMETG